MTIPLDLDQLRTFIAIAEEGSFTKAGDKVYKTQSAVSMQMRKLEEKVGKQLFVRDGRKSTLTEDGERLLVYARRLLQLSSETMAAFDESRLEGVVRFGMPDDFADRFLPEVLARFSESNPRVEVEFACESTPYLVEGIKQARLDLALITYDARKPGPEIVRDEPLHWVTSASHDVHRRDILPLALGRDTCIWRRQAESRLKQVKRQYRVRYSSWSATVIAATVLSGLAVSILPESALKPGMRILAESEGFPALEPFHIALMKGASANSKTHLALADHIKESLGNLAPLKAPLVSDPSLNKSINALTNKRLKPSRLMVGW